VRPCCTVPYTYTYTYTFTICEVTEVFESCTALCVPAVVKLLCCAAASHFCQASAIALLRPEPNPRNLEVRRQLPDPKPTPTESAIFGSRSSPRNSSFLP
jgi:hypothetical protein